MRRIRSRDLEKVLEGLFSVRPSIIDACNSKDAFETTYHHNYCIGGIFARLPVFAIDVRRGISQRKVLCIGLAPIFCSVWKNDHARNQGAFFSESGLGAFFALLGVANVPLGIGPIRGGGIIQSGKSGHSPILRTLAA